MSQNRHPIQKFFITFPKSGELSKHEFYKHCEELNLAYYLIAKESHEDGTPHLHALLWFKSKKTKARLLKFFKDKFPNDNKRIHVQSVRNLEATIAYLRKEDATPLEHPDGLPKRNYKFPNWMVQACKDLFQRHPEEMAREYRENTRKLQNRKKEIDKILPKLLLDYPNSATQTHILEKELKDIVLTLLSR